MVLSVGSGIVITKCRQKLVGGVGADRRLYILVWCRQAGRR